MTVGAKYGEKARSSSSSSCNSNSDSNSDSGGNSKSNSKSNSNSGSNSGRPAMSSTHKAALAQGRHEGRIVRRYLDAIQAKRKRGPKRSHGVIEQRIAAVDVELQGAEPFDRLHLLQERADLERELVSSDAPIDIADLELEFIQVAAAYGKRKGLAYPAWRAVGVSPGVLRKSGIPRTRG